MDKENLIVVHVDKENFVVVHVDKENFLYKETLCRNTCGQGKSLLYVMWTRKNFEVTWTRKKLCSTCSSCGQGNFVVVHMDKKKTLL